jgi:predicted nucleic acid-binding protein
MLLMDDQAGRLEAERRGLTVLGVLGVLKQADRAGLIRLEIAVAKLLRTNFRVSDAIIQRALADRRR